jgi:TPR repeat protein
MAMFKSKILTSSALFLLTLNCQADIDSANAALARGEYKAASAEFHRLAQAGDAKAQTHLGYMYYVGEGVSQDYSEAAGWYRKAAVQGNKDAQYNLAVAYAFGEGAQQDYKEAASWYRRSAEQGHAVAQYSLANSYSYGEGVKQDTGEAIKWFQRSAEQGYVRSQIQLASKFHTGDGIGLDYEAAVKWYRRAADKGDAAAQYNLGSMFRSGKGVTQDYNQSLRWYRMAADQGYVAATNELVSLERALAGASRNQSRPDLQPSTASEPMEKEPLVTVETSDLLTLDNSVSEADQVSTANLDSEYAEESTDETYDNASDETYAEPAPEEEKSGRATGFFKKLIKKDDTSEVAEVEGRSITETDNRLSNDSDSVVAYGTDTLEDTSAAVAEATVEVADIEEEAPAKKKGFFKRLFSKDDDDAAESVAMVDANNDVVPVLEEEIDIDSSSKEDAAMDALEVEEKPKKKGFFKSLFSKDDEDEIDTADEEMDENEEEDEDREAGEYSSDSTFSAETDELAASRKLHDSGDYDAAYDSYYQLGSQGDAEAQYQLGLLYYQGLGIRQDYSEAANWYRRSGEQGNPDAQYSFGNMFLMGEGVSQNDSRAISWYEKAAAQGHVAAEHNIDNLKRVTSSRSVSAEEMDSALENEQLETTYSEVAEAAEEKPKKGFFKRLFNKDEDVVVEETKPVVQGPLPQIQAEDETMEEIAELEEVKEEKKGFFGRLFGKDDEEEATVEAEEEAELAERAANIGEPEQSFEDAVAAIKEYEKGLDYSFGDGVAQDDSAAFAAFLKSAEMAHTPAQYKTGVAYAYGEGVGKDPEKAVYWYKKAAEKGSALAQRNLGAIYMKGDGIEQNKPLGFAWQSILADSGNVMDVHRRDSLKQQLTDAELEQALSIKASLKH